MQTTDYTEDQEGPVFFLKKIFFGQIKLRLIYTIMMGRERKRTSRDQIHITSSVKQGAGSVMA